MAELEDLESRLQDARRVFVDLVGDIRPELHRYCARMTGSVLDGEDMVQEVLGQAFFKLSQRREGTPLRPWLFGIAHNRCIDFLRARRGELADFVEPEEPTMTEGDATETAQETAAALAVLLDRLPPRERSCLLLKDLFGYSLTEIAALTDSTDGAVKSALHRGRAKLTGLPPVSSIRPRLDPSPLLARYIECFNARDWDGVTELLETDARLTVVGIHEGEGEAQIRGTYLRNYQGLEPRWWLEIVAIDGREGVLCWQDREGAWTARSLCVIQWSAAGRVTGIRDYIPVPYLLRDASIPPPPSARGVL